MPRFHFSFVRLTWCLIVLAAASSAPVAAEEQQGMILIPAARWTVGTSESERGKLARRFDCHPTWLGDDLPRHEATLAAYWIDRSPVTNAQYLAFIEATGHQRPDWWRRWQGVFPREYANHPVIGVSGKDTTAYARWAGKRLPTAEEWEAAIGEPKGAIFAWGENWPGPVRLPHPQHITWELPSTRPVGSGDCGHSARGVEDFAGQVLEWVADQVPHHGVSFQMLKGASWFHEDPVNFRTASGWYAHEGWKSALSGFRCALAGNQKPPGVRYSSPKQALSVAAAISQLKGANLDGPITLNAAGGASRHLSIHCPAFGPGSVALSAPETILWNGKGVLTWQKTPEMTWTERTSRRAAYQMRFAELRLEAEFIVRGATVEQRFTMVNLTDMPGTFRTSSCFNLQGHPLFYDCEQLRTFALNSQGVFVPVRRLSRGGSCVRWITGPKASELGDERRWSLLAVVSRDGRRVIVSGRAGKGSDFATATNTLFTCLHTDSSVEVAAHGQATTRQVLWFLEGGLEDLSKCWRRDLELGGR
jgi:formylglycine-generating enzyme required for sulfatase activity